MTNPVHNLPPPRTSTKLPANESLDSLEGLPEPSPGPRIHFWFGVITLIYAFDFADRFLVSAILPFLKADFRLTDAQAGLLGGIVYLGLALCAIPSGALVDRWSRKKMITIMTGLWSLATWSAGFARSFPVLLVSRLAVGAGEAGYNPAGYALIAAWYPKRLRGLMVGLFNIAQPVGAGLGIALAGYIAQHYGWRHVFGVLALPGFALAILILRAPDYRTRRKDLDSMEVRPTFREAIAYLRRSKTLLLILAAQLPVGFYTISWGVWAPTFFVRTFHISPSRGGTAVLVSVAVAGFGPPVGGWIGDRLVRRRSAGRLLSALAFLFVLLVLHLILFLGAGRWLPYPATVAIAAIAQFFMAAHWGSLVAASLDLTPPQFRGTCQSFLPLAQGIVAFWAAALTGLFSDHLGLRSAMVISLSLGVGAALALVLKATRSYDADDRRRRELGSFEIEVGGGV